MSTDNKTVVQVQAIRGYYTFVNDLVIQINELITEAEESRSKMMILDSPPRHKLEGVIMALNGMRDMVLSLEKYGDLIVLPKPEKGKDKTNVDTIEKPIDPCKDFTLLGNGGLGNEKQSI